jgi:hypothetical protein
MRLKGVMRLTKKVQFTSMDKGTRDDYDLISIMIQKTKEVWLLELLNG